MPEITRRTNMSSHHHHDHHGHHEDRDTIQIIQAQPMTYPIQQSCPQPCNKSCDGDCRLSGDVVGPLQNNQYKVVGIQGIPVTNAQPKKDDTFAVDAMGNIVWKQITSAGPLSVIPGSGLTLIDGVLNIVCGDLINHCDLLTDTEADTKYLKLTGGTISGNLTVNGSTTLNNLSANGSVSFGTIYGSGSGAKVVTVTSSGAIGSASTLAPTYITPGTNTQVISTQGGVPTWTDLTTLGLTSDIVRAADSINKLADVISTTPSNGQILTYSTADSAYKNVNVSTILPQYGAELFQNGVDYTAGGTTVTLDVVPSFVIFVSRNGSIMAPGVDYTRVGAVITFATPLAALPADNNITVSYVK